MRRILSVFTTKIESSLTIRRWRLENNDPKDTVLNADRPKIGTDAKIACLLFFLFLVSFGYFFHGSHWGINASLDLTRAIVEDGAITIDKYVYNTGDWSKKEGHYYSAKNPGAAFLAVPVYFLYHRFNPHAFDTFIGSQTAQHVINFFTFSLLSAFSLVLLYLLVRRFASKAACVMVVLSAAFGTLLFTYCSIYSAQVVVANCYIIALYLIEKATGQIENVRKAKIFLVLAGFALGYAVVAEPLAVLVCAIFFGYLLYLKHPWPNLTALIGGAGLPVLVLFAYNKAAFGSAFTGAYRFQNPRFVDHNALMGIFHLPSFEILVNVTVHPIRGLFYQSPIMILAFFGLYRLFKNREHRPYAILCSAIFFVYLMFTISYVTWHGGATVGPRFLIPAVPFLAIPIFAFFSGSLPKKIVTSVLLFISMLIQLAITSVNPFVFFEFGYSNPIRQHIFPLIKKNILSEYNASQFLPYPPWSKLETFEQQWASYNLGELLELRGIASLLPLALFWVVMGIALARIIRSEMYLNKNQSG